MSKEPARFGEFSRRAQDLVQSPQRLQKVVAQGARKLLRQGGGKFAEVTEELKLFIALLRAWLAGDYREVSNKTLVAVATAVLYFVVPLDVIPDFLFGWGLLDDAAVISYVFNQIRAEMQQFEQWQNGREMGRSVDE